ncbi:Pentatricopeptide repeat [Dillenia turbinata]|uniref:Pentatricopeptide repeat n=1 Tax=Dillenia turbinata TaxID=194707 RepID=A0AAN8UP48_9MAGN
MKLDDIEGAEKLFEEWESVNTSSYDLRVPNLMVTGYCKKGLLLKAEAFIDALIQSGKEPNSSTWGRLTNGYIRLSQMDKAVDTLKKAILEDHYSGWKPRKLALSSFYYQLLHGYKPSKALLLRKTPPL